MNPIEHPDDTEAPPFFRSWTRLYWAVVAYLLLLIVLLWVITRMLVY
jgi:hypothetical protein